jgi:hypothetical protein
MLELDAQFILHVVEQWLGERVPTVHAELHRGNELLPATGAEHHESTVIQIS